jgi:hypothetical protein
MPSTQGTGRPVSRSRTKRLLLWSAVALAIAIPVVLLYRSLKPADEVLVAVSNIDASTVLLCLIVDTPAGPEAMLWSLHKVGPFSMHPNGGSVSEFNARSQGRRRTYPVLWREGTRYGVLTRDEDGRWRVFWFRPDEVHLRGRYWILGGGEASIVLPAVGLAEPASKEFLDRVGFGPEVQKEQDGFVPWRPEGVPGGRGP